jgi:hypothetical protein
MDLRGSKSIVPEWMEAWPKFLLLWRTIRNTRLLSWISLCRTGVVILSPSPPLCRMAQTGSMNSTGAASRLDIQVTTLPERVTAASWSDLKLCCQGPFPLLGPAILPARVARPLFSRAWRISDLSGCFLRPAMVCTPERSSSSETAIVARSTILKFSSQCSRCGGASCEADSMKCRHWILQQESTITRSQARRRPRKGGRAREQMACLAMDSG